MILLTEDGQRIDWDFELDPDMAENLARWRDFVEARHVVGHGGRAAMG